MLVILKKNFKSHAILRAIIYVIFGIVIAINPSGFFNFIGYVLAGYLTLIGLINVLEDFKTRKESGHWGLGLFSGIFLLVLALVVLLFASTIASVLPILLGLSIISNGAFQLVLGLNTKSVAWIIYSVILVIGGALLLFNPFASLLILLQVFGYTLIAMGILEVIGYFMFRSQLNK
ncbi:HdeD family acid-resistance protein [Enterococcus casseliflavus]|uniref:HdeD family acid-resistance protein n=1 Tax=Enterococcus casseliflavus TaxID=37734 RepID=UPI0022E6D2A6|nr:DUF308 domain-containing protein [Enterococcus casseliflavus]MEB6147406.1 DUF308 domain-containing protein [Enterococcus casseliflavus]